MCTKSWVLQEIDMYRWIISIELVNTLMAFTSDYISSCKYYFCLIGRSSQLLTRMWGDVCYLTSSRIIPIPPLKHREKLTIKGMPEYPIWTNSAIIFPGYDSLKTTFLWLLKVINHIYNPELGQDPGKSFSLHVNEWHVSYAKI